MSNDFNAKNFLLGTFFGGLVGGTLGLLFAPKSGKQLRKDLLNNYEEFTEKAGEVAGKAKDTAKQYAEKGKEAVEGMAHDAKEAVTGKKGH